MVFSWVFLVSLGMLIGRYYKFLRAEKKIGGLPFWFFIHRPLLIIAPLFSWAGFLVMFAKLNWTWVPSNDSSLQLDFIHSIFGITTLGLTIGQVCEASLFEYFG
jgi:hypothetical protein